MANELLMGYVGKKIRWSSQSQGVTKTKEGKVIGVIHAGESVREFIRNYLNVPVPESRIKAGDDVAKRDRIIVEVPRGGKSVLTDFYTPQVIGCEITIVEE